MYFLDNTFSINEGKGITNLKGKDIEFNRFIKINGQKSVREKIMDTLIGTMKARHAVRQYEEKVLDKRVVEELKKEIEICNKEGEVSIQLIMNDNRIYRGIMAHFAGFKNVSNYIALVGPSDKKSQQNLGFFGQRVVLKAQQLGLNTCWTGATFKRNKCKAIIKEKEELLCVIALGYGKTQGEPHQSKPMSQLCEVDKEIPQWFEKGMRAVMLAPTSNNKQDFVVKLKDDNVYYEVSESKFGQLELGIIKYHFEIGSR